MAARLKYQPPVADTDKSRLGVGKISPALIEAYLRAIGVPAGRRRAAKRKPRGRPPEGPDGLTDMQRAFAFFKAFGISGAQAVRMAGYSDPGPHSSKVRGQASTLKRRPLVAAEIDRQVDAIGAMMLEAVQEIGIESSHPGALQHLADWRGCPARWRWRILGYLAESGFDGAKVSNGRAHTGRMRIPAFVLDSLIRYPSTELTDWRQASATAPDSRSGADDRPATKRREPRG